MWPLTDLIVIKGKIQMMTFDPVLDKLSLSIKAEKGFMNYIIYTDITMFCHNADIIGFQIIFEAFLKDHQVLPGS